MIDDLAARRQAAAIARHRKKGDAMLQRGDRDAAIASWDDALLVVEEALGASGYLGAAPASPASIEQAGHVADLLGVQGGILRRLGRLDEALDSYRRGAELESSWDLDATYNRANAVKLALLQGVLTLTGARPALTELRDVLVRRRESSERAADDAWLWADLADALLLLGEVHEAEDAYVQFARKAESQSPVTTLAVLDELGRVLSYRGDPRAAQLVEDVDEVRAALTPDRS